SVLLSLASEHAIAGRDALHALCLGIEITCRLATMLVAPPARSHVAWFTTGLTAGIGAAATAARLLGLGEQQTVWALGLGAAQACGFRETHATMAGALVPAVAARNGLQAALLAGAGFTGPEAALEGAKGFAAVFAEAAHPRGASDDLGTRFEMLDLSYKPYPCGIVIHPAIDGCIDARAVHALTPDMIERIDLDVHPLTLTLCGRRDPRTGMDAKNSVYHWAAVAMTRGRAGLAEGSDEAVADPAIRALSARIHATADPALAPEAARLHVALRDGRAFGLEVAQARGSLARPMTDDDLSAKFLAQAATVVADPDRLLAACWRMDKLCDLRTDFLPGLGP
ncbi:MAG: MmgE/PrpD family protein, partial [Acetobacteraceae bacterium]|nr:MmgE/PrpD family protein [Acetobacteraceae bacterium]